MAKYEGVSMSVTRRLPRYYRLLGDLKANGVERISSHEFAEIIGLTASQIRQDLNCFGGFGQQGYGYNVATLHGEIGRILSVNKHFPAVLLGAGNLGLALVNNAELEHCGFGLVGIFDNSPRLVGKHIRQWVVRDVSELSSFCDQHKPVAAILCLPRPAAVELAGILVEKGVKGFWNFSSYDLSLHYPGLVVENVHLSDSLMTLSFHVSKLYND